LFANFDPNTSLARFGHNHGYRLEGDAALLNADIDVSPSATGLASSFALQLWACQEPYRGGPLSGFKVAEAPIALANVPAPARHDAVAFAHPPALTGEYSMVLVLAAGTQGAFDQVYDFANYPARQRFIVPHLTGAAGYKLHEDGSVSLQIDRVFNPRAEDNLSGTLSLQLWACDKAYAGGELSGTLLASHELGQLHGQESMSPGELRSLLTRAVNGASHMVLALCEWTALGYMARDYCNFVEPHRAPVSEPVQIAEITPKAEVAEIAPKVESTETKAAPVEAAPKAEIAAKVASPEPAPKAVSPEPAAKAASPEPAPVAKATSKVASAAPALSAKVAPSVPPSSAAVAARAPSKDARPSLNLVSEDELAQLAGISNKMAAQVIKARPFHSFDQLTNVRGIGEKTVQRLRTLLTLER
jgi:hypothetical protein